MELERTLRGGDESFADNMLSLATVAGAVAGSLGGAALGTAVSTGYPVLFGTLGSMFGGGVFAGGWCLLVHVWESVRAGHESRAENSHVTPTPAPTG
jgi:phage tail tape-measure protein